MIELAFFIVGFWFWFVGSTKDGRVILALYFVVLVVWLLFH